MFGELFFQKNGVLANGVLNAARGADICAVDGVIFQIVALQKSFQFVFIFVWQLETRAAEYLNSVVMEWIVRCRDHDSCTCPKAPGKISNAWGRQWTKKKCVYANAANSGTQSLLKHVTASPRVFTNQDPRMCHLSAKVNADGLAKSKD
jgi:hypothetical protein